MSDSAGDDESTSSWSPIWTIAAFSAAQVRGGRSVYLSRQFNRAQSYLADFRRLFPCTAVSSQHYPVETAVGCTITARDTRPCTPPTASRHALVVPHTEPSEAWRIEHPHRGGSGERKRRIFVAFWPSRQQPRNQARPSLNNNNPNFHFHWINTYQV